MDPSLSTSPAPAYPRKPWWQWLLIYLVGGGIVYAGIYYFLFRGSGYGSMATPPAPSPAEVMQVTDTSALPEFTVEMTDSGFSPDVLTIKAGQTVTWVNQGQETVNLKSDPHPDHTDFPPLNLGKIRPGESASLTFAEPGVHGYHNHDNEDQQGKIVVE